MGDREEIEDGKKDLGLGYPGKGRGWVTLRRNFQWTLEV